MLNEVKRLIFASIQTFPVHEDIQINRHAFLYWSNLNFDRLYLRDNIVSSPTKTSLEVLEVYDEGVYLFGHSPSARFLVKK
jgi:hypothetical protein